MPNVPRWDSVPPRLGGEQGTIIASLLILPAVIVGIMFAIHLGLVFYGDQVVTAAAQDGLRVAQLDGGDIAAGDRAARSTLDLFPSLYNAEIQIDRSDEQVEVRVSAQVRTPLPDFFNDVDVTIEGPVERFHFESER